MGANIAGIYGAQIFRQDDRPLYRRGFSINIAVLSVGLTLAVVRFVDDLVRRRRLARKLSDGGSPQRTVDDVQVIEEAAAGKGQGPPAQQLLVGDVKTVLPKPGGGL